MSRAPLETPSRRSREPLSRGRIVAAGLAVLDSEGLGGLSMRRVAAELDTGAMSLYRHVASRDELLDLVLDAVAAGIDLPAPTGDWRADLFATARAIRAALLQRRDLTLLLTARLGRGAAALGALDHTIGILLAAGFAPGDAVLANHALGAYVAGSCTWDAVGLEGAVDPAVRRAHAAAAAARLATLPADAFPHVARVRDVLFDGSADERFEAGLTALLDGFAARLAAAGGAGAGAMAARPTTPATAAGAEEGTS